VEEFVSQTRALMRNADVGLTLVDPDLAAFLDPDPRIRWSFCSTRWRPEPVGRALLEFDQPVVDPASWPSCSSPAGPPPTPRR
jgi:hypothetical protein